MNCTTVTVIFFVAIHVVTVFINQEPSQLTSLQDKGLTDVVMHALLVKDVSFRTVPKDTVTFVLYDDILRTRVSENLVK